jgi:phosphoribosyl 1,2-cyclic phosphate phosphodiesterase
MKGTFVVLGSGNSAGVPAITGWWGNCDPNEPRNRRTRASAAVITESTTLIVDTGPDFKQQCLRESIGTIDGVFYTHAHADHVHGIDDLRTFQRLLKRGFPVFSDEKTLTEIKSRFDFMFNASGNGFYKAVIEGKVVKPGEKLVLGNISGLVYEQDHGTTTSLGIRFGTLAYSTDMKRLDQTAINALKGIDTWIVDANSYHDRENIVHACIEEVVEYNQQIGARQVYITHLPPMMDYKTLVNELPDGYAPAYDGLRLEIEW